MPAPTSVRRSSQPLLALRPTGYRGGTRRSDPIPCSGRFIWRQPSPRLVNHRVRSNPHAARAPPGCGGAYRDQRFGNGPRGGCLSRIDPGIALGGRAGKTRCRLVGETSWRSASSGGRCRNREGARPGKSAETLPNQSRNRQVDPTNRRSGHHHSDLGRLDHDANQLASRLGSRWPEESIPQRPMRGLLRTNLWGGSGFVCQLDDGPTSGRRRRNSRNRLKSPTTRRFLPIAALELWRTSNTSKL